MTGSAPLTLTVRDPKQVMRLKRLGSLHQCRLSFMRILTRRMADEAWEFSCPVFNIGADGTGHAVYCAKGPERTYSLVAFAHDLPAEMRSDRVIAEAWDATFTLFDGIPDANDITRLSQNVPLQEAGRVSESELSLSRANRSVRLWKHVVEALAAGQQPDPEQLASVGYLMRTTAVYGSGKFGAADREVIADRPEFAAPFQAEMLSVFLTRGFVRDLVEHEARIKGGAAAVPLNPEVAGQLGIGNSTGLGMAPFIVNHPMLFNNWIMAREQALLRVRQVQRATQAEIDQFIEMLGRSSRSIEHWHSQHPVQVAKLGALGDDLTAVFRYLADLDLSKEYPWDQLVRWAEARLSEEGQELLVSLLMEPYGHLVDDLAAELSDDNSDAFVIDGSMAVGTLNDLIQNSYGWALELDWSNRENCARAWYVSAEKLEPRIGSRFEEPITDYEQPLAPARDAAAVYGALGAWGRDKTVADFLLRHPEHRHTVRRVQISAMAPYSEIQDNTIGEDILPIDMLRAKLSFFGATHFDPRSDRWVRICMFQGAPYPNELTQDNADYWVYPGLEASP
ncbi:hypothetical protein EBB79_05875 [Parasedimentitalea marina]|uniref:Uncharacterized protein n=1 Tax=Parasedimentitalea marina TaxID=2483033 RepID=A0A3T0N0B8_9RHOB|nr:hypothetical protein [Parasedimentitalea marina]AZV77464.1 hypothetical protein EBB79_05875 [Parasedimentitalea marina]